MPSITAYVTGYVCGPRDIGYSGNETRLSRRIPVDPWETLPLPGHVRPASSTESSHTCAHLRSRPAQSWRMMDRLYGTSKTRKYNERIRIWRANSSGVVRKMTGIVFPTAKRETTLSWRRENCVSDISINSYVTRFGQNVMLFFACLRRIMNPRMWNAILINQS